MFGARPSDDLDCLRQDGKEIGDTVAAREAPEAAARQRDRYLIRSLRDDAFFRKPIEASALDFAFKHGAMLARSPTLARDASKCSFAG